MTRRKPSLRDTVITNAASKKRLTNVGSALLDAALEVPKEASNTAPLKAPNRPVNRMMPASSPVHSLPPVESRKTAAKAMSGMLPKRSSDVA